MIYAASYLHLSFGLQQEIVYFTLFSIGSNERYLILLYTEFCSNAICSVYQFIADDVEHILGIYSIGIVHLCKCLCLLLVSTEKCLFHGFIGIC